jgi:hypothetical protein
MDSTTGKTLQTLLLALHQAATLWSIADGRRSWGKGFAKFARSVDGDHTAVLDGFPTPSASAHAHLAAAQRQVDALAVFTTIAAILDGAPCYKGSAFLLETAKPTKDAKSPTFSCYVDGVSLGDTTGKQTAASIVRKLVAVATTLAPLDWDVARQWTTLDGGGQGRQPLLAPNLETAQIKLAAIQHAGTKTRGAFKPSFQPMGEVHGVDLVRKDLLMERIRKAQP